MVDRETRCRDTVQRIANMAMIAASDPFAHPDSYRNALTEICNFALRRMPVACTCRHDSGCSSDCEAHTTAAPEGKQP